MKATTWRGPGMAKSGVFTSRLLLPAALFAASFILAQCSAVPAEDPTSPAPPVNYGVLISDALKKFKDFSSYSNFQISGPRWVHSPAGWSWLTCVRYTDRGVQRFYSFFIAGSTVVDARYDVRTDQCAAQQYLPFDAATGALGSPLPGRQQPIY